VGLRLVKNTRDKKKGMTSLPAATTTPEDTYPALEPKKKKEKKLSRCNILSTPTYKPSNSTKIKSTYTTTWYLITSSDILSIPL